MSRKERGYNPNKELRRTTNTYVRRVEEIFKNLPKSLDWQSFYVHDLPLQVDICEEVREEQFDTVSINPR
jgi:hypothetical protein